MTYARDETDEAINFRMTEKKTTTECGTIMALWLRQSRMERERGDARKQWKFIVTL